MSRESVPEPLSKRQKTKADGEDEAITLHHYCAGQFWQRRINSSSRAFSVVLGDQLFRFFEESVSVGTRRVYRGFIMTQVSDDYGETWHAYSRFKCALRNFRAVTVAQGSTYLVYLIGHTNPRVRYVQVWVSKDLLKTIELVNANTGFKMPSYFRCLTAYGNLIIVRYRWGMYYEKGTWISPDMGLSWKKNVRKGIEKYKEISKISYITIHRDRLYASHYYDTEFTLVCSTDRGLTWQTEPCGFAPRVLIGDSRGDRLLCFTDQRIYQLVGDSKTWELLQSEWYVNIRQYDFSSFDPSATAKPQLLRNGALLFPVTKSSASNKCVGALISYPDHGRARNDKTRLAIYLGRRGIDNGLFVDHLAPFLFPF